MLFPFTISELCIESWAIPQRVANSLIKDHILQVLPWRQEKGYPMTASLKSGYRSLSYEKRQGRSGASQHVFEDRDGAPTGAVDWTCIDKSKNKQLLTYLKNETDYTRIAYKEVDGVISFIHCDHKPVDDRQLFTYDTAGNWVFIKNI